MAMSIGGMTMKSLISRTLVGFLLIASAAGLSGCSKDDQSAGPDKEQGKSAVEKRLAKAEEELMERLKEAKEQEAEELKQVVADYELPEGATFGEEEFPDLNAQLEKVRSKITPIDFEPNLVIFQPNYFRTEALEQWQCAWLKDGVLAQQDGDMARRDAAITKLLDFKQSDDAELFTSYGDFVKKYVTPLQDGNTEPAIRHINTSGVCDEANQIK